VAADSTRGLQSVRVGGKKSASGATTQSQVVATERGKESHKQDEWEQCFVARVSALPENCTMENHSHDLILGEQTDIVTLSNDKLTSKLGDDATVQETMTLIENLGHQRHEQLEF
jgi:hypothetical protein